MFHADADTDVWIQLDDIPKDCDYILRVFDKENTLIAISPDLNISNSRRTLNLRIDTTGIYYISVSSESGYSSEQSYSLTVSWE